MPTIEELFKSKKLANGQTAQQKYEIQNIADLQRTPYNPLLGLSFKGAQIARRNLSSRLGETKLEEEVTGLRILADVSSPFLYGTDVIKFTTKSRGIVDDMKASANNVSKDSKVTTIFDKGSDGKLSTFIKKAEDAGKNLLSKLGVTLPQELIPSRIVLNTDFNTAGGEYNTITTLQNIKSTSGGSPFGKFITNNLKGRPNENQIIGSGIDLVKKKLNNILLGSPSQAAVNFAKAGGTIYDSISAYSKVMTSALYVPEDMIDYRKDLSTKLNNWVEPAFPPLNYVPIPNVIKNVKTKFSKGKTNTIEQSKKITNLGDFVNLKTAYPSPNFDNFQLKDKTFFDDYDFIPLKFWSVSRKAAVNFRAIITGLNETFSPSWDTNRFVGNPFNFYTYNTIERSVSFNFKIYSLSKKEHIAAWQRLSFLSSLTYPQDYVGGIAVIPPFIKFTLGDMYNSKEGFIESLNYTIDDNTPWEIGLEDDTKNWKLPKVIDVSITIKMVETVGSTYQPATYKQTVDEKTNQPAVDKNQKPIMGIDQPSQPKSLYGYGNTKSGTTPLKEIEENWEVNLNADGSPKNPVVLSEVVVKSDKKAKKPENAISEAAKQPEDPKGTFVTEYKGYQIYEKKLGPFRTLTTYDFKGSVFHTGDRTAAAPQSVMVNIEKEYINSPEFNSNLSNLKDLVKPI